MQCRAGFSGLAHINPAGLTRVKFRYCFFWDYARGAIWDIWWILLLSLLIKKSLSIFLFRLPLYYTPYDVTMVIFPSKIDLPKRVSKGPNMASLSALYIYSMHVQCLRNTFCRKHDTVFLALQYWSNLNTASSLTSQSVNNLHITCFTSFFAALPKSVPSRFEWFFHTSGCRYT